MVSIGEPGGRKARALVPFTDHVYYRDLSYGHSRTAVPLSATDFISAELSFGNYILCPGMFILFQ